MLVRNSVKNGKRILTSVGEFNQTKSSEMFIRISILYKILIVVFAIVDFVSFSNLLMNSFPFTRFVFVVPCIGVYRSVSGTCLAAACSHHWVPKYFWPKWFGATALTSEVRMDRSGKALITAEAACGVQNRFSSLMFCSGTPCSLRTLMALMIVLPVDMMGYLMGGKGIF